MSEPAASGRVARIEARLREVLAPAWIEIEDESHRHAGHPGAADGRGHFRVRIASERFAGRNRLARHRLVYEALEAELEADIHALALETYTPAERPAPS